MLRIYDTTHYCKYYFHQDMKFDIGNECTALCKLRPVCIPYKMSEIKMKK